MGRTQKFAFRILSLLALMLTVVGSENKLLSKSIAGADSRSAASEEPERHARSFELAEKRRAKASPVFSDSYLIDSIITIVQNYYVDESRVESRRLLESTLQNMVKSGLIEVEAVEENRYRITKKNRGIEIVIEPNYSFDDLVDDSSTIIGFLEKGGQELRARKYRSGSFAFLDAMLSALDPHSNLLNPDEYQDLRQGTDGAFGGLGIVVGIKDDVLTVVKPLPKSPASRAGLNKSDKIIKIDGKSTFGSTLDDLVQYMRGEPGTAVSLSVLSEGGTNPKTISLVREVVQVESVESKVIKTDLGNILYASIESFSSKTSNELKEVLARNTSRDKLLGLVLDLRSNPGGLLDQAVKVADLFLDDGKIVSTVGRSRDTEFARRNFLQFNVPVMVLVNGDTASASEIVAGALRDHGRALIIGEPSFGKGSVQTVFELPGEMALKLTIARYFTPSGISIQNKGILPDIWLQGVHSESLNKNLNALGEFRYKSERFLDHTLDPVVSTKGDQTASRAYFYLKDQEDDSREGNSDIPLNFAVNLLRDLGEKEGIPFPQSRLRASYWKASLQPKIHRLLQFWDEQAVLAMNAKMGIDWKFLDFPNSDETNLILSVDLPRKIIATGKSQLKVPWKIINRGEKTVSQVSIFASSSKSSIQTNEKLLGRLDPGQILEGSLQLELGSKIEAGSIPLRIGLASGGLPIANVYQERFVERSGGKMPEVTSNLRFFDDLNGKEIGVLESGEQGDLELSMTNKSSNTIDSMSIQFLNLSGEQFKIVSEKTKLRNFRPGETRIIRVKVEASKDILSSNLEVGVKLSFDSHVEAKRSRFIIPSRPSPFYSRNIDKTGDGKWKEN